MAAPPPLSKLSFRWQITLLGAMVVLLLGGTFVTALNAMGSTRSAVLSREKKSVAATAVQLGAAYEQAPASPGALKALSRRVLQDTDGTVGGFYWVDGEHLSGYAYPGNDEAGEGEDLPLTIKPTVLDVAREAVSNRRASERVLTGLADVVLLHAVPIEANGRISGAAWAMERLSSLPGSSRMRAYLEAVGLGLAALLSLTLTLLVVRNLQQGVRKIESGLQLLEGDLASRIDASEDPEEIQRIAKAINLMGANLREGIEKEKQIENRMRHSERLAALGRLVAAVAHEVRNPLATIRLRVQMCDQDALSAAVHESCAVALEEIERLNGMVNRLLSFSQPVQLHTTATEIEWLVEQRLAGFQEKARHQGVQVVTRFSEAAPVVHVDQSRMAQVFDNVIQNAIEAMIGAGGTLSVDVMPVHAAAGPAEVCVEFRDTGKGMSAETASRVFDPFFTTKATGTGLGLSICHELVRAHGGEIHVSSTQEVGTRVRILLPAATGQAQQV